MAIYIYPFHNVLPEAVLYVVLQELHCLPHFYDQS